MGTPRAIGPREYSGSARAAERWRTAPARYPWPVFRPRLRRTLAAVWLATAVGLAGLGRPVEPAAAGGFALELQERGDFVAQTNLVQCVGASMQMMINVMAPRNDRTAVTQHRLWLLARSLGPHRPKSVRGRGASPVGWARGLDRLGYGPYLAVGSRRSARR